MNQTTTASSAGAVMLTGGNATITAPATAASTVKAEPTPGGVTSTSVGVGASVALNLVTDTTTAALENAATLTGAANVTLSATVDGCGDHRSEDGRVRRQGRHRARGRGHPLERDDEHAGRHRRDDDA